MKYLLTTFLTLVVFVCSAQIPTSYYSSATGTGYTLKSQLHDIIDGHNEQSYSAMWDFIYDYDLDAYYENDGSVLDIYSENPTGSDPYNWTRGTDQCGSYSGEGSCYNREHSFPKSWFNDASPMTNDAHHLYPTDGYVNGQRGSFPFGEVGSASFTSQNGSKKGSARSGLGYSGTVFEPIDEFKGDLARTYFYMATRYEDLISSWNSPMLDGSSDQVYTTWALDMLMDWHTNDPVSQKEIDRNNNIYYNHQGNRNPFVDHPEWVNAIWGDGTINDDPVLTLSATSTIDFGTVQVGFSSSSQSYSVSGDNLEGDVFVSVSSPFEVSLDDNNWTNSVTLGQANVEAGSNNTVYVRFSPQEPNGQTYTTTISHSSTNASTINRTVTGLEGTIPIDDIAELRTGSNGTEFTVEGVVTSPELNIGSGQFFIQDATGGVFVYYSGSNSGIVSRGDLVRITGERDTYRDQVELLPTSVEVLASNQTIPSPEDISESDVIYTSFFLGSLVRLNNVSLTTPSEWPTSTTSIGTSVSATIGTTSFLLRIDENSYYDGTTAPSGNLTITGVLDVYDGDIQIYPFVEGDVQEESSLDPALSVDPTSLSFGNVGVGTSVTETITITGSDLSENVTVTTFGDYQVSSDNLVFGPSLVVGVDGGSIDTDVYVKYEPSSAAAHVAAVSLSSSGESASVTLSGTGVESSSPTLVFNTSGFNSDFGTVAVGSTSDVRSYVVSGSDLDGAVTVQAPTGFEVSVFNNGDFFSSMVNLGVADGTLSSKTIYVRFKPTASNSYDGSITHTSGDLVESLALQGSGGSPSLLLNSTGFNGDFGQVGVGQASISDSFILSGNDLTESVMVSAPEGFEVSDNESTGYASSISIAAVTVESSTDIYVRFVPNSSASFLGDVVCSSGGTSESISVSGSGTQVLNTESVGLEIKVFPNPVNGILKIENLPSNGTVRIFDSMGRRMNVTKLGEGIDVSEFNPGQYYLTVGGSKNGVIKFLVR